MFPRSVNVRRQLVQKALAQIEVDITVPNPTSFTPTYLIVRNADGLNFTVAFRSSVKKTDIRPFVFSLSDELNSLDSLRTRSRYSKCLVQRIEESLFSLAFPLSRELFDGFLFEGAPRLIV